MNDLSHSSDFCDSDDMIECMDDIKSTYGYAFFFTWLKCIFRVQRNNKLCCVSIFLGSKTYFTWVDKYG